MKLNYLEFEALPDVCRNCKDDTQCFNDCPHFNDRFYLSSYDEMRVYKRELENRIKSYQKQIERAQSEIEKAQAELKELEKGFRDVQEVLNNGL